jgi:hypothetical protein
LFGVAGSKQSGHRVSAEEPGSYWLWSTITYDLIDALTYKFYNSITYDMRGAIPYEWPAAPMTLDRSDGNAAGKAG